MFSVYREHIVLTEELFPSAVMVIGQLQEGDVSLLGRFKCTCISTGFTDTGVIYILTYRL